MTVSKLSCMRAYAASLIVWWLCFPIYVLDPWLFFPHIDRWLRSEHNLPPAPGKVALCHACWWFFILAVIVAFGKRRKTTYPEAIKSIDSVKTATGTILAASVFWTFVQFCYDLCIGAWLLPAVSQN